MFEFIDVQCTLGRRNHYREGSLKTTADILEMMDKLNISKAIACHSVALENNALVGNQMLLEEVNNNPRFLKQWCVIPNTFDAFMDADTLISHMKENDVVSIRMRPGTFHHSVRPYAIGRLMSALAAHRIPLFLDADQLSWDEIFQMCQDYPNNRIVITTPGYEAHRQLAPILETCPNIYLGTARYVVHGGLKSLCERYGADRILFESAMPYHSAAAAVSLVCYADISEAEKQAIASGNIKRLLSEVAL